MLRKDQTFWQRFRDQLKKIPLPVSRRTALIILGLVPLVGLFVFVVLRSGPLAPVPVTVTTVEVRQVSPALFGIGAVEAKSLFKIGPNAPGRVRNVFVNVGDRVRARQLLAEMERPDLDILNDTDAERQFIKKALQQEESDARERLRLAEKTLRELVARQASPSEISDAQGAVVSAREDLARAAGSAKNPLRVSANLRLVSPVQGLVTQRSAEPGTTVVAGQAVVEVVDPKSLWINVRFDQVGSAGLSAGLGGKIVLRSQSVPLTGRVLRVEPLADAITEETLAKVVFDALPIPLPPIGELAEVTIILPSLLPKPTIPNASLVRVAGELGVWALDGSTNKILFKPVKAGATDLEGNVQILEGLQAGERVVVYSQKPLKPMSRNKIVDKLIGAPR
ncbi:MAG TPA: efflux RND transporter periplasmic adaptor subunit [Turneriella sp.]|nr:efflux RND transporter periplasmic adaptor subunit [Turneriella sp.]